MFFVYSLILFACSLIFFAFALCEYGLRGNSFVPQLRHKTVIKFILDSLGVLHLKKGELIGLRMDASQIRPSSRAIGFVPEECYFGVERKA